MKKITLKQRFLESRIKNFRVSGKILLLTMLLAMSSQGFLSTHAFGQPISPEDLLNEDDFDEPPPGTFIPSEASPQENFIPPPPALPSSSGTSSGKGNVSMGLRKRKPISQASVDEITNENYPDIVENFDFQNAEITDVIKAMSELTGKNFIIDPVVRGKITVIAPTKVSVAEAYRAFLSSLAINGFSVVPSGKFLKVKPARDAQKDSIETYSGAYAPNSDQMITRITHLKHVSAPEVKQKLGRTLQSKYGEIEVYEPTNSLIISDFGSNVERIMGILRELDVKGFEEQMEVIRIRYAKAKDIAELMDQIINKGEKKGANAAGFTSGIPRFGQPSSRTTNTAADAFSLVIPDERTNSIIVVGNRAGIEKIRGLVAKLDRQVKPDEAGGVYVYYVKNTDAEKLAQTLSGIAQEQKKAPAASGNAANAPPPAEQTEPIFGSDVKIAHSKDTNALIITASKQDYQVILNLLRKIDIPRDQVYVESVIMEMSVESGSTYGVSYFQFNKESNGVARSGFSSGNLGTLLDPTSSGAILGFASGEAIKLNVGGQETTVTSTLGFINFLKSITTVNILSTPQVLAMDNEESEIEVGDTVPVSASTSQGSTTATTSVTREDATIKLKIKPHISKTDDTIRIEFDQQIKQLSSKQVAAKALADSAVVTTKRALKSNIVVRNGDTAVLGGLMRDQEDETVKKIPLLGDIPILGWLFKGKSVTHSKVNLLVFITPHVMRTASDRLQLLGRKLSERVDYVRQNMGGRDPFGRDAEGIARSAEVNLGRDSQLPGEKTRDDSELDFGTGEGLEAPNTIQ